MRLVGRVAWEIRAIHTGHFWVKQKERDKEEDLDIGGRLILKRILEV
jgi:hypothetical protein